MPREFGPFLGKRIFAVRGSHPSQEREGLGPVVFGVGEGLKGKSGWFRVYIPPFAKARRMGHPRF